MVKATCARLDVWARAEICTLNREGYTADQIVKKVKKKDKTAPTERSVRRVIRKKRKNHLWRGQDSRAGGRPPALTLAQKRELFRLVVRERGKAVVVVKYVRKRLPFLRRVSRQTVGNALHEAGLAYLRRRPKSVLGRTYKVKRIAFCKRILRCRDHTLRRFAFTDGTTFYLARGPVEAATNQRACLGKYVWRMANGKDGLHDDNVGGSLYAKAQGRPVKIWGLLAGGRLEYYVLPADGKRTTNMTGKRYNGLIQDRFASWRRKCFGDDDSAHLIQDHERCLWQPRNLRALHAAGLAPVMDFPKCSPDLNVLETWWHRLRQRLDANAPSDFESRPQFIRRLRRTVDWMNTNIADQAFATCTSMKNRARAVNELQGGRCLALNC